MSSPTTENFNKIIVAFKKGTPHDKIEQAVKDVESKNGRVTHRYTSALLGFAAEVPNDVVQSLNVADGVDYIEADGEVTAYTRNLLSSK